MPGGLGIVSGCSVHWPGPCSLEASLTPTPSVQAQAWGLPPSLVSSVWGCAGLGGDAGPACGLPRPWLCPLVWPASSPPSQSFSEHSSPAPRTPSQSPCPHPCSRPPASRAPSHSLCIPTLPKGRRWRKQGSGGDGQAVRGPGVGLNSGGLGKGGWRVLPSTHQAPYAGGPVALKDEASRSLK